MDSNEGCVIIFAAVVLLCVGYFFHAIIIEDEPKAIDVYRGKTTLEITYKDSVAIDSVVVFKMRNKNN